MITAAIILKAISVLTAIFLMTLGFKRRDKDLLFYGLGLLVLSIVIGIITGALVIITLIIIGISKLKRK
jgi:hypothetical protein